MATELTEEQLKHWRQILSATIGPYALLMPAETIQKIKDQMQDDINRLGDYESHFEEEDETR